MGVERKLREKNQRKRQKLGGVNKGRDKDRWWKRKTNQEKWPHDGWFDGTDHIHDPNQMNYKLQWCPGCFLEFQSTGAVTGTLQNSLRSHCIYNQRLNWNVRTNNKKSNDQRGRNSNTVKTNTVDGLQREGSQDKNLYKLKQSQRSSALMRISSLLCYCRSLSVKGFGVSTFKLSWSAHTHTHMHGTVIAVGYLKMSWALQH